ncbi:MAG: phosphoribosylanthranilate isomerase [Pirellulales bacterium]|nr:phosphoribosylanthranilate isomerase [Pirellulales bacterium]
MFQIKICGVTRVEDALAVAAAGADALGLNFYGGSPRCVSIEIARQIANAVPQGILRVGVFVNHSAEEIRRVAAEVPLDAVQLHGDEAPEMLAELAGLRTIKAVRVAEGELEPVAAQVPGSSKLFAWFTRWAQAGSAPEMILIDAHRPGLFGGSGQLAPWAEVARWREHWPMLPLALAGGLNPRNVAEAIRAVAPTAVDTASGVESAPGVKDHALVRAFVHRARQAFAARAAER